MSKMENAGAKLDYSVTMPMEMFQWGYQDVWRVLYGNGTDGYYGKLYQSGVLKNGWKNDYTLPVEIRKEFAYEMAREIASAVEYKSRKKMTEAEKQAGIQEAQSKVYQACQKDIMQGGGAWYYKNRMLQRGLCYIMLSDGQLLVGTNNSAILKKFGETREALAYPKERDSDLYYYTVEAENGGTTKRPRNRATVEGSLVIPLFYGKVIEAIVRAVPRAKIETRDIQGVVHTSYVCTNTSGLKGLYKSKKALAERLKVEQSGAINYNWCTGNIQSFSLEASEDSTGVKGSNIMTITGVTAITEAEMSALQGIDRSIPDIFIRIYFRTKLMGLLTDMVGATDAKAFNELCQDLHVSPELCNRQMELKPYTLEEMQEIANSGYSRPASDIMKYMQKYAGQLFPQNYVAEIKEMTLNQLVVGGIRGFKEIPPEARASKEQILELLKQGLCRVTYVTKHSSVAKVCYATLNKAILEKVYGKDYERYYDGEWGECEVGKRMLQDSKVSPAQIIAYCNSLTNSGGKDYIGMALDSLGKNMVRPQNGWTVSMLQVVPYIAFKTNLYTAFENIQGCLKKRPPSDETLVATKTIEGQLSAKTVSGYRCSFTPDRVVSLRMARAKA